MARVAEPRHDGVELARAVERVAAPWAVEVALLDELETGAVKGAAWALRSRGRGGACGACDAPPRKALASSRWKKRSKASSKRRSCRCLVRRHEQRVDARLDGPLAKELGAEASGSSRCARPRAPDSATSRRARVSSVASALWRARSISVRRRSFISPAAFSVNVTATIVASVASSARQQARGCERRAPSSCPYPPPASTTSVTSRSRADRVARSLIDEAVHQSRSLQPRERDEAHRRAFAPCAAPRTGRTRARSRTTGTRPSPALRAGTRARCRRAPCRRRAAASSRERVVERDGERL